MAARNADAFSGRAARERTRTGAWSARWNDGGGGGCDPVGWRRRGCGDAEFSGVGGFADFRGECGWAVRVFQCDRAPAIRGGAPPLSLRAMLLTLPVWVGDYVALTLAKMPDMTTGSMGVTGRIY